MPQFQYKAYNSAGKEETGVLDAPGRDALIDMLQQKGLVVLSISKKERANLSKKAYKLNFHNRVTSKDLIQFVTQMAVTLEASIPLLRCLNIQIEQVASRTLKKALEDIRDNIKQGHSLKDSLARHPRIFSLVWINLIGSGEASGQLPAILYQLAEYITAKNELKRKTVTALIYPAALVSVCILAIYIFTIKVIPIFAGIFKDFHMQLPLITRIVMGISAFLRAHILLTLIIVSSLFYLGYRYVHTRKGRRVFDNLVFRIPIFGTFILNSALERFSSSLSMLLKSGISILQALNITAKICGNKIMEEALGVARSNVRDGKSLSSALKKSYLFPPITVSMCDVGEETGRLDSMLDHITKYYRDELTIFANRLSAVLEPIVIIIMGSIVFVLVLAMYMPIFQIALLGGHGG